MPHLAGSQWSLKLSPKQLNGMYVSAFAFCASLIVPKNIIQSHRSEKYPIIFFGVENEVRQKSTCYNLHSMYFKKLFSLILGLF